MPEGAEPSLLLSALPGAAHDWLIEKNGHRSPNAMLTAWHDQTLRRAA